jgi:hypothetical protein
MLRADEEERETSRRHPKDGNKWNKINIDHSVHAAKMTY